MHSLPTIAVLNDPAPAPREPRRHRKGPPPLPGVPPPAFDPVRITIETSPQVAKLLDRLAGSGLYGYPSTREAAAEEILRAALREIEMRKGGR